MANTKTARLWQGPASTLCATPQYDRALRARLFHLSPVEGLEVLEPRSPQHRTYDEAPDEPCVCAGRQPAHCAVSVPYKKGRYYLYEVVAEDIPLFGKARIGAFSDSGNELRAYEPVRVVCHGVYTRAIGRQCCCYYYPEPYGECSNPNWEECG